jgi:hypothetical protein
VGTHLHGWNPRGDWWGEGDDKFFIDGEKFPSSFGTGSEDYFGYAWSSAGHFSRPYHNQILNEDNAGHFDDNRWHIPDSVPFQTSFEGDIEKYFTNARSTFYAAEVFWYLNAGGTDPYPIIPVSDRIGYWVRPETYRVPDVIEAETLPCNPKAQQPVSSQPMFDYGANIWSNDHELTWWSSAVGQSISLELPAQKPGKYDLLAHYSYGPGFGIMQVNFNGVDIGSPVDFYAPTMRAPDVTDLGVVELTDAKPIFKITVTGKNDASKGFKFGLDYLKLVPAP